MKKNVKKKSRPLTNRDGEVRELTHTDFRAMRPASEVLSPKLWELIQEHKKTIGQRGPQKAPTKIPVTVRYSPEVISYFKNTGRGWQTKMDDALREWIKKHKPAA